MTLLKLPRLLPLLFVLITACSDAEKVSESPELAASSDNITNPMNGTWLGKLLLPDGYYIPFNFEINGDDITIQNSSERIPSVITEKGDSMYFKMPAFDSEFKFVRTDKGLKGVWINNSKKDYRIPFSAAKTTSPRQRFDHNLTANNSQSNYDGTWESHFGVLSDPYNAVGIFEQYQNNVTGTFLTETGDYRYLQGNVINDTLFLSCFDGAHAFLFTAVQNGDSIKGMFRSGKHYTDSLWVGVKNEDYKLQHPDSLTYIKDGAGPFVFELPGLKNETVSYPSEKYYGKVTIVQIFGSWCPNCKDEAQFYSDLYEQYNSQGLEIVGLGFERPEDLKGKQERIKDFAQALGIEYDLAVGGSASKPIAEELFPQLNHVISFPTSIFIDRNGNIRKVHTGFYGPGTGKYYVDYKERITHFITDLLKEEAI